MATKPGHHYGGKPVAPEALDRLREMRELSLDEKIERSLAVISCWHDAWDSQVCVSYSGGKDSSVLLWLVRQLFPQVPAVFCHTGLEYPELLRQVNATPNVVTMRPRMPFHQVIAKYGWPLISKRVSRGISFLRHPTPGNANIRRLYDEGVNRFGEPVARFRIADRWRFLIDAPFEVSDLCCNVMKKEPTHRYQKMTGRMPFLGLLAGDSQAREKGYLQHGCNAYDLKNPRSTPLGFWTEQDVLDCIRRYCIQIPGVYGDIIEEGNRLRTSGVQGTGCVFCAFGLHMETGVTRFQHLYHTHPKLWDYCMNRLGLGKVLDYCRQRVPAYLSPRFAPCPASSQGNLLEVAG